MHCVVPSSEHVVGVGPTPHAVVSRGVSGKPMVPVIEHEGGNANGPQEIRHVLHVARIEVPAVTMSNHHPRCRYVGRGQPPCRELCRLEPSCWPRGESDQGPTVVRAVQGKIALELLAQASADLADRHLRKRVLGHIVWCVQPPLVVTDEQAFRAQRDELVRRVVAHSEASEGQYCQKNDAPKRAKVLGTARETHPWRVPPFLTAGFCGVVTSRGHGNHRAIAVVLRCGGGHT
mmetsp:Transcript_67838/g.189373  ORF Transcript_67838/g.189373 Transcript_67838/m.189373 type:complete len:233 (-) Transcript_67838:2-700(-)